MNFYKHFLGDYARDTAHLSMLEHGAYRLMLDHYYATGNGLPSDKALLYRICKAASKAERTAVDIVADAFFAVNGDGSRHNKRADKEIGQWTAQAEINRELGKRGGRPKKTESVSQSVSESEPIQEPNRNPSHSHSQKKPKKLSSASADLLPGFVKFWNAWPRSERKQGKSKCLAIWRRKALEEKAEQVVAHVERMSRSESWQGGFDPMPETYLNGDRWDGAELGVSGHAKHWTESWSGIAAKAAELGVFQQEGESAPDFKRRVMNSAKEVA